MAKGAPADTALGESAVHQQFEAVDRTHRLQGHRLFEPEGRRCGAQVVIGGVEVAVHHAGHDGAAGEIDHPIVRPAVDDRPGAHRGDPVAVHHHMGTGKGGALAVHDRGIGENETGHGWSTTLMASEVRSPATRKASVASSRENRWVMTVSGRSGTATSTLIASSNSETPWWCP